MGSARLASHHARPPRRAAPPRFLTLQRGEAGEEEGGPASPPSPSPVPAEEAGPEVVAALRRELADRDRQIAELQRQLAAARLERQSTDAMQDASSNP